MEHANLRNLDTGDSFEVLFNPSEYNLTRGNTFASAAIPGLSTPLLQFVNGNLRALSLELLFDSYERNVRGSRVINEARSDVRKLTRQVTSLLDINPDTHAPPIVLFSWGDLSFTGVLVSADQRFTMFLDTGVPVRAQIQVTLHEYKTGVDEAKSIKRQTADYTHQHQVVAGDTLSNVAWQVYRDSAKWRPIAIANDLVDARRLRPGSVLTVPRLPYRDPSTGEVHR